MDATSFGDWLKQRRMALHVTRDELAQRVGCAVVTLRKIEADERRPSKQIAARLAEALDLSPVERGIFIKVARAEFNVERLALLALPLERSGAILPSGTVTFLCTEIENNTIRWEHKPEARHAVLARHDSIMKQAVNDNKGIVVKRIGNGILAVFARAPDALEAAFAAQHTLQTEPWDEATLVQVRMALHSGVAEPVDNDYVSPTLDRVICLLAAGHGGQTLLSLATMALVRDHLPSDTELRDLGLHRLKDLSRPEQIFQFAMHDLPSTFPPLTTLDTHAHNLPAQSTSLIGREREVAAVCALLHRTYLVL